MENNKNEYIEFGKQVINKISEKGGKAYFYGECVRNIVLKKPITKVQIFSTLSTRQLLDIFEEYCVKEEDSDTIRLIYMDYLYYITSYKNIDPKEITKSNGRHIHADLVAFLETSDFVNDAIAMQYSNRLIDPFEAIKLNKKKKIKMFGNPKRKFMESPIRMIRLINLVSQTGFRVDKKILKAIGKKKKMLSNLSTALIAMELKGFMDNEYSKQSLALMINTGMYKKLTIFDEELKRLAKKYKKETNDEFIINSLVKCGYIDDNICKGSVDEEFVRDVVTLALSDPKCNYDSLTIYKYGLKVCLAANKTNCLIKKAKKKYKIISKDYEALPIKSTFDLAFKAQDVLNITKTNDNKFLEQIMEAVQIEVVLNRLPNDYDDIREFIIQKMYELKNESSNNSINDISNVAAIKDETVEQKQEVSQEVYNITQNVTPAQNVYYTEDKIISHFNELNAPINNTPSQVTDVAITTNYPGVGEYYEDFSGYPVAKAVKEALFQERIRQINLDALEDKLNNHIDALIKKSNALDEVKGNDALDMYKELKVKYRKILMEKYPEYSKLKERYSDRNGISND